MIKINIMVQSALTQIGLTLRRTLVPWVILLNNFYVMLKEFIIRIHLLQRSILFIENETFRKIPGSVGASCTRVKETPTELDNILD